MARIVYCLKLKKAAEGLTVPPLPGSKGQWIYKNISKEIWSVWQSHQTRLINEKHLNLLEANTRKYLAEQMDNFFSGKEIDSADGYIPK